MGKYLQLFILYVATLLCVEQSHAQYYSLDELQEFITQSNAVLPQQIEPGVEMVSMSINSTTCTLMMKTVNDALLDNLNSPLWKDNIGKMLSYTADNDFEMGDFYRSLVDLEIALRYVYISSNKGKRAELTFTADELDKYLELDVDDNEALQLLVQREKARLPIDAGNGVTETDLKLLPDALEIVLQCDEQTVNMEQLEVNRDLLIKNIENAIISGVSLETNTYAVLCAETNRSLKTTYKGGKKTVAIVISKERLNELIEEMEDEY